MTETLDLKGYTIAQVQHLIDRAIENRAYAVQKAKWEQERRDKQAQRRVTLGQRNSIIASLKKHGITVRTQSDYYGAERDVSVASEPDSNGDWRITLHQHFKSDRLTNEARQRKLDRANKVLHLLLSSETLNFETKTEQVRKNYWKPEEGMETNIYFTISKKTA